MAVKKKVPAPVHPYVTGNKGRSTVAVSGLGVELESSSQSVVLEIDGETRHDQYTFVLSLRAAAQLEQSLSLLIDDYLYGDGSDA